MKVHTLSSNTTVAMPEKFTGPRTTKVVFTVSHQDKKPFIILYTALHDILRNLKTNPHFESEFQHFRANNEDDGCTVFENTEKGTQLKLDRSEIAKLRRVMLFCMEEA